METAAEKTARLRAMRYARDGSPDEIKARKCFVKEYNERVKQHNTEVLFAVLGAQMKKDPEVVVDAIMDGSLVKVMNKYL